MISERLEREVGDSGVRKDIVENGEVIAKNPEYAVDVGLLARGAINCALYIPPKIDPIPEKKEEPVEEEPKKTPEPPKKKPEKKKGPGLFGRLTKSIDTFGKGLFDDEDDIK